MSSERPTESLGHEGDACAQCGAALATDQRYCLNCGAARAEPRLDFQKFLRPAATGPAPATAAPGGGATGAANPQWSPALAILGIGLLGVMLLLGVLIGKDDDPATVAAAPAVTTTTATPTAPPPTDTAAATPTEPAAPKGADVPGGAKVAKGGSGSTEGIPTADLESLEAATQGGNESQQEASKKLPDVVATNGPQVEQDPNGKAGGNDGSPSACIGC